jgi:molybdopterin molybdotransferase
LFFTVKTIEEVLEILRIFSPVGDKKVSLEDALGHVTSREITSPEDLPGFYRSSMDGYAVTAKDTFGATESLPVFLEVTGEVLMGESSSVEGAQGKTIRISTGGMLPKGTDGVVMLEYCHSLDDKTIEISRAISPLENVIKPDDDFKKDGLIFKKGHYLRPQDLGLLAGVGISEVSVFKSPRVAIVSTGDEIVPIDKKPKPGQVRDINSYTLSAFCRITGAEPIMLGLCRDSFSELRDMVAGGLDVADTVWISGGSSVGTRDMTLKVFESFNDMELLVHGISISPGKPTIIARIGEKAVFGLPGHTASAMVVAEVFLNPFLFGLIGRGDSEKNERKFVEAELSRNIESASGRDDFIRVRLDKEDQKLIATPVFGKSGLISTLVEADGLLRIDRNIEGLYQGEKVKVMLFSIDGIL